jgi:hypothetical protein
MVAVACLVVVVWRWFRERAWDLSSAPTIAATGVYGGYLANAYRVLTAPTEDANIGGGLYALAFVPVTVAYLAVLAAEGIRARAEGRRQAVPRAGHGSATSPAATGARPRRSGR